jgi:hypothetical protein
MSRILYCHCAYARVVPLETKAAVLERLAASGVEFDAVPDLCEMAARHDPQLAELASQGPLRVAACYPRAVTWLFASAGVNIEPGGAVILNMRTDSPERVVDGLLAEPVTAPAGGAS